MSESQFRYCFTLDTEPDNLWEFNKTNTFEHFKVLPAFHRRMSAAGSKPTYLTTSEVVEDPRARAAMSEIVDHGSAEIGVHFHSWTRQWPFPVPELRDPPIFAMAHQLGQRVEEQMLAYTCASIREHMGIEAKSFRGGRWSFNEQTPTSLLNCGITVGSTITPGLSWRDNSHPLVDGPDWLHLNDCKPLFYKGEKHQQPLVEIPVGSANFHPPLAGSLKRDGMTYRVLRKAHRLAGLRFGTRWLRPTSVSVDDMRAVLRKLKDDNVPVWMFMIHSSEVAPCIPLPSQRQVDEFIERCEQIVGICESMGATAATMQEAGRWVSQKRAA